MKEIIRKIKMEIVKTIRVQQMDAPNLPIKLGELRIDMENKTAAWILKDKLPMCEYTGRSVWIWRWEKDQWAKQFYAHCSFDYSGETTPKINSLKIEEGKISFFINNHRVYEKKSIVSTMMKVMMEKDVDNLNFFA